MKTYAHILFIALFICILSCRSNKSLDRAVDYDLKTQENYSRTTSTNRELESSSKDSSSRIEYERQFVRTIKFDSTGRVLEIREAWRDFGSQELGLSQRGLKDVSLKNETINQTTRSHHKFREITHLRHAVDSRPVQGMEWIWVIIGISLVAIVVWLFIKNRAKFP